MSQRVIVGVIVAMALAAGCASDGSSSTRYYLHWNCGRQSQCVADWGANTGIQLTYTDMPITVCIQQMIDFANNGTIQEWNGTVGDWCDNVDDPAELEPPPGY